MVASESPSTDERCQMRTSHLSATANNVFKFPQVIIVHIVDAKKASGLHIKQETCT